jgi:hypothetical protein
MSDVGNKSYSYYADMCIEKLKNSKSEYAKAVDDSSISKIKQAIRNVREYKLLMKEMELILRATKQELINLRNQDIT